MPRPSPSTSWAPGTCCRRRLDTLVDDLAVLAGRAADHGVTAGVEQMYTPHQVPWTIAGATDLLQRVHAAAGHPWYLTIDVGHQSGQHRFQRPSDDEIHTALRDTRATGAAPTLWVGSEHAGGLLQAAAAGSAADDAEAVARIRADITAKSQFFAAPADGDPDAWLRRLAPWSPIIHLQQTDGTVSKHWAFTADHNRIGIIDGERTLAAIAEAYAATPPAGMPRPVEDLYLTIEVFSATADTPQAIRARLQETVAYWRRFVPRDGMLLEEAVAPGQVI